MEKTIFLTSMGGDIKGEAGPDIPAESWEEAEAIVDHLVETFEIPNNIMIIGERVFVVESLSQCD